MHRPRSYGSVPVSRWGGCKSLSVARKRFLCGAPLVLGAMSTDCTPILHFADPTPISGGW